MTKIINTQTSTDKEISSEGNKAQSLKGYLLKFTKVGVIISAFTVLGSEVGLAAFDLDAGGKALTDPLVDFFNNYYTVGILGMGAGGTIVAQGDLRTKAYGFGCGCLLGGLIVAAVKAGMGI